MESWKQVIELLRALHKYCQRDDNEDEVRELADPRENAIEFIKKEISGELAHY